MGHLAVHGSVRQRVGESSSALLALAAGLAVLAVVFLREIVAAVEVWNASTAYSHCYLVLPMALYLLWERRAVVKASTIQPGLAWAWLAVPISLGWLCAERLGIMEGRQLAAIAGLQVLFVTVLGTRFYGRLAGPLLFLFFLVPFGAFLTPALQRFTAGFSIIGLDLLGIPNYSDGFTIETSAGLFFVAEACAGLRFLVAAVAFGVFYSLLTYTTMTRRLIFIALSIAVPIIANGFRALGIVVLGQILGSAQAAAADHIVYGWAFFSLVMLMLIGVGQLLRGGEAAAPALTADPAAHGAARMLAVRAAIVAVLLLGIGPAIAVTIDSRSAAPMLASGALIQTPEGCLAEPSGTVEPSSQQRNIIECGGTRFVVLAEVFAPRSTSGGMVAERRRITQELGAEDVSIAPVDNVTSGGKWTLVQTTDPNRVTAYASWVDGIAAGQGLAGRFAQARDSLLGADHAPLLLTISTLEAERAAPKQRAAILDQMRAVVRAQGGLDQRVERATRVSAAASR